MTKKRKTVTKKRRTKRTRGRGLGASTEAHERLAIHGLKAASANVRAVETAAARGQCPSALSAASRALSDLGALDVNSHFGGPDIDRKVTKVIGTLTARVETALESCMCAPGRRKRS